MYHDAISRPGRWGEVEKEIIGRLYDRPKSHTSLPGTLNRHAVVGVEQFGDKGGANATGGLNLALFDGLMD
ncbi:MAG: hypothetical protein Q9161_009677 [Pseudevernia consocians]